MDDLGVPLFSETSIHCRRSPLLIPRIMPATATLSRSRWWLPFGQCAETHEMSRLQLQRNWIFLINYVLSTCKATKLSDSFPRNPLETWFGVVEVTGKIAIPNALSPKKNELPLDFLPATSLPRNAKADVVRDDLRPHWGHPPKRLEGCSVQPSLVEKVPWRQWWRRFFSLNPWCCLAANLPNMSGRWRFINISVVLWQCRCTLHYKRYNNLILTSRNIAIKCDMQIDETVFLTSWWRTPCPQPLFQVPFSLHLLLAACARGIASSSERAKRHSLAFPQALMTCRFHCAIW